jgi:hypothetical protein
MAVSRSAIDAQFTIDVELEAAFTFADTGGARRAVRRLRRRYRASAAISRGESGEWEVLARLPAMRFELERVRLLAQDLDELAGCHGGELVTWEAVRPRANVPTMATRVAGWLRRRWAPIVGADVVAGVVGGLLAETIVVASAVAVAMVEGGVWLAGQRRAG